MGIVLIGTTHAGLLVPELRDDRASRTDKPMPNYATKKSFSGEAATVSERLAHLKENGLRQLKKVGELFNTNRTHKANPFPAEAPVAGRESLLQGEEKQTVDFNILEKGGLLQIVTRNTIYSFRMLGNRDAMLSTNQNDHRPAGLVQLRGCTLGRSDALNPHRVFCGGNLQFLSNTHRTVHLTSEIKSLRWAS